MFFKPPLKIADFPPHDRQTVIWQTNNLHGLHWDEGDIPYCDLKTICLEDLNCPRISEIISEEQVPSCHLYSNFRSKHDQLSNHCAERKARKFSQWTQSDAQRRHGNFNNLSVRQFEDIHLLDST